MTRVDIGHMQVDGVAPRSVGTIGIDHIIAAWLGGYSKVDIIFVLILTDVRSPYAAQISLEGIADGLPMDEVPTMEDGESWLVVKGRVGHVVVTALAHDGWVRIVASQNRVRVGLGM